MNKFLRIIIIFLFVIVLVFGIYLIFISKNLDEDKDAYNQAIKVYKACFNRQRGYECYEKEFDLLAKNNKLEYSTIVLEGLQKIDPSLKFCHLVAHQISAAEVSKSPNNWMDLFNKIDVNKCSMGFFHGVIEGHSRLDPQFILNENTIPQICSQIIERASKNVRGFDIQHSCAHAIGHLLLVKEAGDIQKAVAICEVLSSDLEAGCYLGVFMESSFRENLVAHGISNQPLWDEKFIEKETKVCEEYTDQASIACWHSLGNLYSVISNYSPVRLFEMCKRPSTNENRISCYFGGIVAMSVSMVSTGNNKDISLLCKPYLNNLELYDDCIDYVVMYTLGSSDKFTFEMVNFCQQIGQNHKDLCFEKIKDNLNILYSKEKQKEICSEASSQYTSFCKYYMQV